jgi:hypothetical protein
VTVIAAKVGQRELSFLRVSRSQALGRGAGRDLNQEIKNPASGMKPGFEKDTQH